MRFSPALALCLLAQSALAQTYMGMDRFVGPTAPATPTPPSANCPYGNSLGDGCPGALSTATQQTSGLFTSFPANGQTYQTASFTGSVSGTTLTVSGVTGTINPNGHDTLLGSGIPAGTTIISGSGTTWTLSANLGTVGSEAMTSQFRPSWNVAGVDYPVGAPPANTLTDPSTLPVCSGSTYALCINPTNANIIEITAPTSGSDVTIDHYDFSLHGGYNVTLFVPITGNFNITNNKWAAGSSFQSGGNVYNYYGSCGSVMLDANSRSDTVSGVTTIKNNDFNGMADTGSSTTNCPGSFNGGTPAIWNIWPSAASNTVLVEYNYLHDYNPRIQFGYGATIKYNVLANNNYNTPAHGELTAFNESCGAATGCPGTSTIDLEYNTLLQSANYCGGQTAPIFLGSGSNSGQTTNVTNKNNVYLNNGCLLNVTVNNTGTKQITFTTNDGSAGQLTAGYNICTAAGTTSTYIQCPAVLSTQVSGTTGGGGVWNYTGTLSGTAPFSVWLSFTSSPSVFMTGETYQNVDSENNYVDGTGVGNFADEPQTIGDCGTNSTASILHPASRSITSSGNKWMTGTFFNGGPNENYGQFSFTTCLKFAEGFVTGTTASSTLSVTTDSVFTGNINVDDANALHATAITSGTIQTGDVDSILDTGGNVQRGTQILNQTSGSAGGIGVYSITNPSQTVTSQTMTAARLFGTVNSGSRTDTLFGNGVGAGITVTSGVCATSGCVTSYGLSSNPGTLSSRNFTLQVP